MFNQEDNTYTVKAEEYMRLLDLENESLHWQEKHKKMEAKNVELQKKYDVLVGTKEKVVKGVKYQKVPIKVLAIGSACIEECEKPRNKYIEDEPKTEITIVDILTDMAQLEKFVARLNKAIFSDNFQFEV